MRAAITVLGLKPASRSVSSALFMVLPAGRILGYADCTVILSRRSPRPAGREIALTSARTHQDITNQRPIVAMLSFSTKGSAHHPGVEKGATRGRDSEVF